MRADPEHNWTRGEEAIVRKLLGSPTLEWVMPTSRLSSEAMVRRACETVTRLVRRGIIELRYVQSNGDLHLAGTDLMRRVRHEVVGR